MDIYTNPQKNTYVTGITKLFRMPTDSGGIPAVAVSKNSFACITSAYTILVILIFMIGWNLILAIIMAFWPTRGDPNRQTALVALWNSGEPMNATTLMATFCKRLILYMLGGNPEEASSDSEAEGDPSHQAVSGLHSETGSNDTGSTIESAPLVRGKRSGFLEGSSSSNEKGGVSNLLWGLLFVSIALAMTVGNVVAGILIPVQLSMGNVAPPAKDAIFYPDVQLYTSTNSGAGLSKLNSLFAASALRALGSIEASEVTVRKRVYVDVQTSGRNARAVYNYNVTGVDMGLQSDPKLQLRVNGSCRTDYTWLTNSTKQLDTYRLFGGNSTLRVNYQPDMDYPPMLKFAVDPNTLPGSNTSYAMIINTGGLSSYTPGQDPWYATDKSRGNTRIAYQVVRGRPVLSCWEESKWHLNGKEAATDHLDKLPGLKLHTLWVQAFKESEFRVPRVVRVGRGAGQSVLKSASYVTAPLYTLDAGASTMESDLERLVLAAWVSSRSVLRDTTTYDKRDMQNHAEGPGGSVEADVVQFVLRSGDVVTLSARILISVPSILLFLLIVQKTLGWALGHPEFGKRSILPGEKINSVALLATQLYRGLDQRTSSRNWNHTESLIPFVYPPGIEEPIVKASPDEKPPTSDNV